MNDYPIIIFMAILILAFGIVSKRVERTVITAPMVFVLVGLLVNFLGIGLLEEGPKAALVKPFAELTLILVLFIDASTIDRSKLKLDRILPLRLLLIGLPLTMIMGSLIAIPIFPEIGTVALMMMALILSPTDAALGQAVVTSELVPIRIRQSINVESGLNDGIALPLILICFAILTGSGGGSMDISFWLTFVIKQFLFGPIIGGFIGWFGGLVVDRASRAGWMSHTYQMLASVSLAILSFSLSEEMGGNGFIGVYFAGLMLGTHSKMIRERIQEFGEAESQVLIMFIFLLFGMILIPLAYSYWDWRAWVYAILSLTVVRIAPVALSLIGTGLDKKTVLFIGWFGPRGIASVLYLLMAVIQLGLEGYEKVISVISLTVLLSIFLHGITALPFSKLLNSGKKLPT